MKADIVNHFILRQNGRCLFGAVLQFCRYSFFLIAFALFFCGYFLQFPNMILCGVLFLFLSNLLYSFADAKRRIVFLLFHVTLFTFLLSRPFISMLRGNVWWHFDAAAVSFALNALFLTLLFLRLGAIVGEAVLDRKNERGLLRTSKADSEYVSDFRRSLQIVSLIFFIITMSVYLMLQIEKLIFMQGRNYAEIYSDFHTVFPFYVETLASMMKFALCFFLATMPSKRVAVVPLFVYWMSAVPALIIGQRALIVLHTLFILLYYIFRDIRGDERRWLGNGEILFLLACSIPVLFFLGSYNYIRDGAAVSMGVWDSIVDLFYKQGVSFDVLCMGYSALPDLPDVISKNYTFGPFIDYFQHGTIAQTFFGAQSLGSGNSEIMAIYGHSFADSLAYTIHPGYLNGQGYGSSYLLETFADWGYGGIIVFSSILGMLFSFVYTFFYKNTFVSAITLICLLNLFYIPRAPATSWLQFLTTMQFWLAAIFCYTVAGLCCRSYSFYQKRSLNHFKGVKSDV